MEILLVNINEFKKGEVSLPLGILSLATILKSKGFNVKVLDFNQLYNSNLVSYSDDISISIDNVCDYILDLNPRIVSFYTMCNSYHNILSVTKKLKERNKDVKILLGGPHASLTAKSSMAAFPWIDAIGIGEGELTIESIVNALLHNDPLHDINGLAFRHENSIFCNDAPPLIKDLDSLPFIDYSLINLDSFQYIPLDVGRGCPFGCTYCSTKTFWKRNYRLKSSKRIVDEIKYFIDNHNINKFTFVHDLFTVNRNKILEFCNLVIKENLNIEWSCSARVDTLDEELIKKLKEAGCDNIYLGIETGSERMQKLINKNLKLSNIWSIIDCLKLNKIKLTVSFIYGFPNETLEDLRETLNTIKICYAKGLDSVQLHLLSILPGTEMFNNVKNQLEFGQIYSDIADSSSIKNYTEMIHQNPDIFSQYFDFKTEIRQNFRYLDIFVNYFAHFFSKKLSSTYKLLLHYYNDNLLTFFEDFKTLNFHIFENSFSNENKFKSKGKIFDTLNIVKDYINNKDFGELDGLIKELFKFESNILEFSYLSTEPEECNSYIYDVYSLKMNGFSNISAFSNSIILSFNRIEKKHINIKKLA